MSFTAPARHRAPRRLSLKPAAKVFVTLAATSGLALSTAGSSQAAPAAPKSPASKGLAFTPAAAAVVAPATTPAPTRVLPTPSGYTTYRWGSRGGSVRTIQRIVGAYPDGVFGPKTHSRVKSWQRSHGLYADGIVGPKTSRAMGLSTSSRSSSSASRSSSRSSSSVITNAKRNLGVRYTWAGSSPRTGFDCSGFVTYVFKQSGISLPRTASAIQRRASRTYSPRPGDLVFHGFPATHVGIYAGGGKFYDSGRSTNGTTLRSIFPGSVSYGRVN